MQVLLRELEEAVAAVTVEQVAAEMATPELQTQGVVEAEIAVLVVETLTAALAVQA